MELARRKKGCSVKRKAKPGRAGKQWKRETSRKKELREFEKSRSDSDNDLQIVTSPVSHNKKGEKWFKPQRPTDMIRERRFNRGIGGYYTCLTPHAAPHRLHKTLAPLNEGFAITRQPSYSKPSGLLDRVQSNILLACHEKLPPSKKIE